MLSKIKKFSWRSLPLIELISGLFIIGLAAWIDSPNCHHSHTMTYETRGITIVTEEYHCQEPTITLSGQTLKDKPLHEVESLAESGSSEAQKMLGTLYWKDTPSSISADILKPADLYKSLEWYKKAAQQGDAEAHYYIGRAYEAGAGDDKDNLIARTWYQKGAYLNLAPVDQTYEPLSQQ